MSSTEMKSRSSIVRLLLNTTVVSLPILLPTLVLFIFVRSANVTASLGSASNSRSHYGSGLILNGKLIFNHFQWGADREPKTTSTQLRELDFATGIERESNLPREAMEMRPMRIGDQSIVFHGRKGLYRLNGDSMDYLGPMREVFHNSIQASIFDCDGQISTVVRSADGAIRLQHLVDGEWIDGRRIRLPMPHQLWYDDHQTGEPRMWPLTLAPRTTAVDTTGRFGITITQCQGKTVLLMAINQGFVGYREGIEYDDQDDVTSALAPENGEHEASGWQPLPMVGTQFNAIQVARDAYGVVTLMRDRGSPGGQVYRPNAKGDWDVLPGLPNVPTSRTLALDPSDGAVYIVEESWFQPWNVAAIRKVERDGVSPEILKTTGTLVQFLKSRRILWVGLILTWLVHFIAMIALSRWFCIGEQREGIENDFQTAKVAAGWQRLTAVTVDLSCVVVLVLVIHRILVAATGCNLTEADHERLGHVLLAAEQLIIDSCDYSGNTRFGEVNLHRIQIEFGDVVQLISAKPLYYGFFAAALGFVGLLKTIIDGMTGFTPGKRLTGVRTVNLSLKPPMFGRSLVRDMFGCIDYPFLLTPIPAVLFMALTSKVQRSGDYVAETAVVLDGSIRQIDPYESQVNEVSAAT